MTDLDEEVRQQVRSALDRGDIQQIHDILDALEAADNPNVVKVEFTTSQLRFLKNVQQALKQPGIDALLRMIVDGFKPGYEKAQREARKAQT